MEVEDEAPPYLPSQPVDQEGTHPVESVAELESEWEEPPAEEAWVEYPPAADELPPEEPPPAEEAWVEYPPAAEEPPTAVQPPLVEPEPPAEPEPPFEPATEAAEPPAPDPDPDPVTPTEPEPPADPVTAEHRAEAVTTPPPALDPPIADVDRTAPPMPARSSARPLPTPPRRRYTPPDPRRSPATGPARRSGRRWIKRIFAVLALLAVAFVLWFIFSLFQPFKGDGDGTVVVNVPRGATSREVGDLLADRGVVSSGFFFDLRAQVAGKRDDLKAGRFELAHDMSYGAAIDKLTQNPVAPPTINVTIPEGLSRKETAPLAKKAGVSGSYLAASDKHAGFSPRSYGAPRSTKTLEGFLFPATYEMGEKQATAGRLVGLQLDAFKRNFDEISMTKAKRRNLTPYDVLIIASMIEREAQVAKERELISAVIYNRLKQGIPLGIDATTRYELGQWSRPLRVSELQKDTPYNTRTRRGLPPTPIGNPGLASMKAAADPASAKYIYYVVKPGTCGEHAFSSTNAQFQRDVQRYEQARAKNGGKSPDTC
ncbi:Endolytic murein transglycosylase [Capillimicrobium parvum]|uniref:Endolytic murein transglycosylase n=2 Tax=Capillimicrobium parvum TaxID=2884022 RepID=A0A9E6XZ48_9ACTN|nr:Endolytic murein transglycosylase [Capillimicrobium parvum]